MKKIPLTKGKFALVDDEDFEKLSKFNWCYQGEYAARWKSKKNGEQKDGTSNIYYMHRVILGLSDRKESGLECDHINGNKLDNRRENLRTCTHAENMRNSKPKNRFGYKGVVKYSSGKYQSMIWNGKKNLHLGMFVTVEEAAKAYDKAAKRIHGAFASLNFP